MPDPGQSCSRAEPKSPQISGPALKRLQKEMRSFVLDPPDGLQLVREEEGENLGVWQVLTAIATAPAPVTAPALVLAMAIS